MFSDNPPSLRVILREIALPKLKPMESLTFGCPGRITKFYTQDYDEVMMLGRGGFGRVILVRSKTDDELYAAKIATELT